VLAIVNEEQEQDLQKPEVSYCPCTVTVTYVTI